MFKKTLLVTVLCMSLVGLTVSGVSSWPLPTFTGWPTATWGSINLESILKKVNINDGDVIVSLSLDIKAVQCYCCNGGDQCGGLGEPFFLNETISATRVIEGQDILKNGIYYYVEDITNEQIYDEILPYEGDICQNSNWSIWYDEDHPIIVTKFYLELTVYAPHKIEGYTGWEKVYGDYVLYPEQDEYTLENEGKDTGMCISETTEGHPLFGKCQCETPDDERDKCSCVVDDDDPDTEITGPDADTCASAS